MEPNTGVNISRIAQHFTLIRWRSCWEEEEEGGERKQDVEST